ncbi:hypothetical protein EJ05DRAFT_122853 [Pseudovirgaria hyperparasitica]|uniref:Uncharacterized protein n=1 Tax=Pseudovirgaria hyperparasitica TaxID=470096 RepID=A0A6A6VWZ2_9PEZI|nr:uncharacterized protein EJ05DRAFT_122853 [Pseudovirgaria hyperparasitica]KAF2755112.1 hypothetical protein EJ05DRAFT_122853 [Pseudovirgaria hyperparasitica]
MALPRELRDEIYFHALVPSYPVKILRAHNPLGRPGSTNDGTRYNVNLNLTMINSVVRDETLRVFYTHNSFTLPTLPCPLSPLFKSTVRAVEIFFSNADSPHTEPALTLNPDHMVLTLDPITGLISYQEPDELYEADQIQGSRFLNSAWSSKFGALRNLISLRSITINVQSCFWRDGLTRAVRTVVSMMLGHVLERGKRGMGGCDLHIEGMTSAEADDMELRWAE